MAKKKILISIDELHHKKLKCRAQKNLRALSKEIESILIDNVKDYEMPIKEFKHN